MLAALSGVQRVIDARAEPTPTPGHRAVPSAPPGAARLAVAGLDPSACFAYPAGGRDRHQTVFLDAGHGGPDPGTSGSGTAEKDAALAVELEMVPLLRDAGFRVVVSRTADTAVAALADADFDSGALRGSALHRDLVARIACANAAHADVLVAIHFNGFDDSTASGSVTFYDAERPFAARSLKLARALQAALVKELGLDDRGVSSDDELQAGSITDTGAAYGHLVELGPPMAGWVDRPSGMPGALVEPLFLTAPGEGGLAASARGQAKIARALADGVLAYLGGGPG